MIIDLETEMAHREIAQYPEDWNKLKRDLHSLMMCWSDEALIIATLDVLLHHVYFSMNTGEKEKETTWEEVRAKVAKALQVVQPEVRP